MRSHRIQQRGSVTTAKTVQTESAFQVALLSLFLPFHSFEVSSYSFSDSVVVRFSLSLFQNQKLLNDNFFTGFTNTQKLLFCNNHDVVI